MTKWADYCIWTVRYDNEHTHIISVKAYPDKGDSLGNEVEFSRAQVINYIENGTSFVTIVNNGSKWRKGEDVHVVNRRGKKYIRTDQNDEDGDNLGSLPEY